MVFNTRDYPTITLSQVNELIAKTEREALPKIEVYRVRNDQVIETFGGFDEAENFINEQDYDRTRVMIRETGRDPEARVILVELRSFRDEANRDCLGFVNGTTLNRRDAINAEFARARAIVKFSEISFNRTPFSLIDWNAVADQLKSDATSMSQYASLGSTRYYCLEGL